LFINLDHNIINEFEQLISQLVEFIVFGNQRSTCRII